jgi:hypothetical protein
MTLGLKPLVAIRPALLIARKAGPALIPAAVSQLSTAALTQVGRRFEVFSIQGKAIICTLSGGRDVTQFGPEVFLPLASVEEHSDLGMDTVSPFALSGWP